MDANKERYYTVIDISKDLIQTRIDNEKYIAIINIRGIFVDMLLDIDPDVYGPCITIYGKRIKQLITQCINSIYGTMVAIILYYCTFCKMLELNKFKMNPYYSCVANRMVNGLQKSIILHVNDCKLRQNYTKVNYSFIVWSCGWQAQQPKITAVCL